MPRKEMLRLMIGFRRFREKYFLPENSLYSQLSQGAMTPKTLIIGCSDSRVDPAIVTSASPGELFVVRNVANLVPPYDESRGFHGVSSAIEFAVLDIKVENIIILGHRQCGGIRALMTNQQREIGFVTQWMGIAKDAKKRVLARFPDSDEDTLCRACEQESIVTSLDNLRTFPFIREAVRNRGLNILGVFFDLEKGELLEFDEKDKQFKTIDV